MYYESSCRLLSPTGTNICKYIIIQYIGLLLNNTVNSHKTMFTETINLVEYSGNLLIQPGMYSV